CFFFQAEDGIRAFHVTGVQTCALPILRVVDANNANVPGVTVSLVSGDTQDIYNMNGYKDFKLTDNLLTLGVDPARTATANNPIRFRVQFSAPGYITQTVPVALDRKSVE